MKNRWKGHVRYHQCLWNLKIMAITKSQISVVKIGEGGKMRKRGDEVGQVRKIDDLYIRRCRSPSPPNHWPPPM